MKVKIKLPDWLAKRKEQRLSRSVKASLKGKVSKKDLKMIEKSMLNTYTAYNPTSVSWFDNTDAKDVVSFLFVCLSSLLVGNMTRVMHLGFTFGFVMGFFISLAFVLFNRYFLDDSGDVM